MILSERSCHWVQHAVEFNTQFNTQFNTSGVTGPFQFLTIVHDAIYRLRFYLNSLIHILSLSNLHLAWIQKNRGDKSHRVIVALPCAQRWWPTWSKDAWLKGRLIYPPILCNQSIAFTIDFAEWWDWFSSIIEAKNKDMWTELAGRALSSNDLVRYFHIWNA